MRTKPSRTALLIFASALTVGLLAGCGDAKPDSDSTQSPTSKPVEASDLSGFCDQAALLAFEDPQAAIDLIDAARAPAKEAADRDDQLTADQIELLTACDDVRVSAGAQVAADALADLLEEKADKAEEKANKTPAEKFGEAWADVIKNWFTPLSGLGLLVGALIAVQLLLARFATRIPKLRNGWKRRWVARTAFALGITLIVGSSVWIAKALTKYAEKSTIDGWCWIAAGVATALVGTWMFSTYLASRLRLTVEAQDEKGNADKWATARIVTALSNMGAAPSRGLEVPTGSDIDALASSALPAIPGSKVLEVIQNVVRFVFLGTPWRITVIQDGEKRATVSVVHNGESVSKDLIDLERYKLPEKVDKEGALLTFASASILIALSRRHKGFEGLAGTERWPSFGLQVLSARFGLEDPELQTMLKLALTFDSGNHVAIFMLQNALHRDTTKPDELSKYYGTLTDELKIAKKLNAKDLALRLRLVSSLIAINILSAVREEEEEPPTNTPPKALSKTATAAERAKWTSDKQAFEKKVLDEQEALNKKREARRKAESAAHDLLANAGRNVVDVVLALRRRKLRRESLTNYKARQLQAAIAFEMLSQELRPVPAEDAPRDTLPEDVRKTTEPTDLEERKGDKEKESDSTPWNAFTEYRKGLWGAFRTWRAGMAAKPWISRDIQSQDPGAAYNLACYNARIGHFKTALANLEIAVEETWVREYARKDRDLRELSIAYKTEFDEVTRKKPRSNDWDLEPFAALKSKLIEAGVPTPGRLTRRFDNRRLAKFLEISRPVLERLHNLARLLNATEGRETGVVSIEPKKKDADKAAVDTKEGAPKKVDLRVELVAALIDAGVESPEDIPDDWTVGTKLEGTPIRTSATAFEEDFGYKITNANLARWLSEVRQAGATEQKAAAAEAERKSVERQKRKDG